MPASPSFHSDGRGKWKRRKRRTTAKHEDTNEDNNDNDEPNNNNNATTHALDNNNNNNLEDSEDPRSSTNHEPPEVLPDAGVRISDFPPAVKRVLNRPHSLISAIARGDNSDGNLGVMLENVSYGQLQVKSAVPADASVFDQEGASSSASACVIKLPAVSEAKGVVKRFGSRVHVVPMHSDWFSPSTIHRLERQVVPHFFSGKSPEHTPEKYIECRNYIVAKYMDIPEKRLTVADCQGLVTGVDNEDITRMFRFLDSWGIINYCASEPNHETLDTESYLKEDPNGEIHVPTVALKSIDSLIKFDRPKCKIRAAEIYSSSSNGDDISDLENKLQERFSENHCQYCSKPVCVVYYQSQKEVDIVLCSDCFHEGRFVSGHSSLDFVRVDSTSDYGDKDGDNWSDQETLLLLEAIEMYNDNWNEISDHVGSKSKDQCILHFLRLPMEDGLLENIEVPGKSIPPKVPNRDDSGILHSPSNGNSKESCSEDVGSEGSLPFAKSANPVMSLVAFLTSAIGPRVAAVCAHAALAVLSEDGGSSNRPDGHGNRMYPDRLHDRDGSSHGESANSVQQKEESLTHGSRGQNEADSTPISAEKVKAAARAGLSAAATKAKLFADHEEREIQRLSANIINQQLRRLEMKLKQLAELEGLLMRECEQVERTRQRFAAERGRILSAKRGPAEADAPSGVSPTMINSAVGKQVMSASPSQANISGYNSQLIHPQMPFMPQQQSPMYGFGPRLPLTAIQTSTSSPPNVLFNSPASSRPPVNNSILRPMSGTSSGLH